MTPWSGMEKVKGKFLYMQMCIRDSTGTIDAYFGYVYGKLEYRSLKFETEVLDEENHQGVAVVNYTDRETPYTRMIEHKHFEFGTQPKTVITRESVSYTHLDVYKRQE